MKTLALLAIALIPSISHAATCTRADLTGQWRIYTVFDSVTRCTLNMPSSGNTISTVSACYLPGVVNSTPLRGTLYIATDCRVYGSITIGTASRSVDAYISKGKDSISGMAWQSSNVYIGNQFNGVKQ